MRLPVAILAGGLGTRLGPLSQDRPKILMEVGGQPFAIHQLSLLKSCGFTKVIYCVGHFGEQISAVLGDGQNFGMQLEYSFDGSQLLGTGGALKRALPHLGSAFLVLYGDSYLECDYLAVQEAFIHSGRTGLMTVFRNEDRWDKSNVVFADNAVRRYDKRDRTEAMHHIDYGLAVLSSKAFEPFPEDSPLDLMAVYQALIAQEELAGFEVYDRFYEIGSIAGLQEIERYLGKHRERQLKGISF